MRAAFRVDASRDVGTGHVIRCATLATALAGTGVEVAFYCKDEPGNLNDWLGNRGLQVRRIAATDEMADAEAISRAIGPSKPDWLIVDHYGLGIDWEKHLTGVASHLFAIDDLGRAHDCDMLLDQNYANPLHDLYVDRVPPNCQLMLGPQFALIRPEFASRRTASLARSRKSLSRFLVFMGGIDEMNETEKALGGIARSRHRGAHVDVVIGEGNPNRDAVQAACAHLPNARLHVQTPSMASLMSQADLMLCAGGSTNWERCTLSLPALVVILAENQRHVAEGLEMAGAHKNLGWHFALDAGDYADAIDAVTIEALGVMSQAAAAVCDGKGVDRVMDILGERCTGQSANGSEQ